MYAHPFSLLLAIGALLVSSTLLGCNETQIPEDFELSLGEGGGVTGRWTVHRVANNGDVFLRGQGSDPKDELVGTLSETHMNELWQALRDSALMTEAPNETGNMTRMLRVTANGQDYDARWPMQVGGDPSTIEQLYMTCTGILQEANSKN